MQVPRQIRDMATLRYMASAWTLHDLGSQRLLSRGRGEKGAGAGKLWQVSSASKYGFFFFRNGAAPPHLRSVSRPTGQK